MVVWLYGYQRHNSSLFQNVSRASLEQTARWNVTVWKAIRAITLTDFVAKVTVIVTGQDPDVNYVSSDFYHFRVEINLVTSRYHDCIVRNDYKTHCMQHDKK